MKPGKITKGTKRAKRDLNRNLSRRNGMKAEERKERRRTEPLIFTYPPCSRPSRQVSANERELAVKKSLRLGVLA